MSFNPSEALLTHTLSTLTSSLQVLSSLNLLSDSDRAIIASKLPSPQALSHLAQSPLPASSTYSLSRDSSPSPYPAPIYGGNSNDSFGGGGGAQRIPPPLPGRSYPGLGEARAVWDYHGGAPDDLIFKKDDIIVITEEMNNEWFKGHLLSNPSRIGLFPSTYVTKLPPRSRSPATSFASSSNNYHSPPPPQHYQNNYGGPPPSQQFDPNNQQQMQPYNNNQMQPQQQQGGPVVTAPKPPGRFDGMGKLLATSAVGGVGFGAGSAVGSGIIHAIF